MVCTHLTLETQSEAFIQGKKYFNLRNYQEALRQFELAKRELMSDTKNNNDIIVISYYLGKTYLHLADYNNALLYLRKHLDINSDCLDTIDSIGYAFQNKQMYEEAEKCYNLVLKKDPNFISTLHNIGLLKSNQEDFPNSKIYLERAYELDKANPFILHSLANLYDQIGESEMAFIKYEEALKYCNPGDTRLIGSIHTDYAEALNQVGHIYYQDENYNEALRYYEKARSLDSTNLTTLNQIGMCKSNTQDFVGALEAFNQSIRIADEKDADGWINRGCVLKKDNKLLLAKGALNIARDLAPNDEVGNQEFQEVLSRRVISKWKNYVKDRRESTELSTDFKALST